MIATDALTVFVVSVSEVAVIVIVPPGGTVGGAVYVVLGTNAVLPEIVGLNDPQATEPHVAAQITPPLSGSFVT